MESMLWQDDLKFQIGNTGRNPYEELEDMMLRSTEVGSWKKAADALRSISFQKLMSTKFKSKYNRPRTITLELATVR
jgi:hypothetical protein